MVAEALLTDPIQCERNTRKYHCSPGPFLHVYAATVHSQSVPQAHGQSTLTLGTPTRSLTHSRFACCTLGEMGLTDVVLCG